MKLSLVREIRRVCIEKWQLSLASCAVLLLGLAMNLLTPWPLRIVIDDVLNRKMFFDHALNADGEKLAILALSISCFFLIWARGFFNFKRHVLLTELVDQAADQLRLRLLDHVLHLRQRYFDEMRLDDFRSRLNEDVDRVRDCYIELFSTLFGEVLTLIGVILILAWVDWRFAAIGLGFFFVLTFVYSFFPKRIGDENLRTRALESDRTTFSSEVVRNHFFVKSWVQEDKERERLGSITANLAVANRDKAVWEGRFIFSVESITALVMAVTLGYGAYSVSVGAFSIGDLVLFLQYLALLYGPIGRLSAFLVVYHKGQTSWQRIQETMRLEVEPKRLGVGSTESGKAPRLEFENVSFSYADKSTLFKEVAFAIEAGKIAAIVGPSGTGKSTLLKLVLGFYDLSHGRILIDGKAITDMSLQDLRKRIAYVDQESRLLGATVLESLQYGSENLDNDTLMDVCKELKVDHFVSELAHGYDTPIADGGANFSLGQRQRMALARAIASGRDLILMDEPTSALDQELERELVGHLPGLLKGKTTIIVTHRPAPLEMAHQIYDLGAHLLRPFVPASDILA